MVELYPDRPGWRQTRNNIASVQMKFSRRHFRHLVSQLKQRGYLNDAGVHVAVPRTDVRFLYRMTIRGHQGKQIIESQEWGPIAAVSRQGELRLDPSTIRSGYALYQSALSHLEEVIPLADDPDAVLWERLVHAIARNLYPSS